MKALSAPVLAALSAAHVVLVTLVKLEFSTGTICLHTGNWPTLEHGGDIYRGAYGLGTITPITDQPGELPGVQLEIQRPDSDYLALALDEADVVQGAVVTISTAIFDTDDFTVLHVETDFAGYADVMTIGEDAQKSVISLTVESKGVDLLRGNPLTYTDADQQSLVPGDRWCEYVVDQADKPVVWPTREFYFQ